MSYSEIDPKDSSIQNDSLNNSSEPPGPNPDPDELEWRDGLWMKKVRKITVYPIRSEKRKSPRIESLMESSKQQLEAFFGKEIVVPPPPSDFLQTIQELDMRDIVGMGLDDFYYLPRLELTQDDPIWQRQGVMAPDKLFWALLAAKRIDQQARIIEAGWYIGEGAKLCKPNVASTIFYKNDERTTYFGDPFTDYERFGRVDYMEKLLANLPTTTLPYSKTKLHERDSIPKFSRFGLYPREIEEIVLPEFQRQSGIIGGIVKPISYLQFNMLGNMRYPQWGKTNSQLIFSDTAESLDYYLNKAKGRLMGGTSNQGGLADVTTIRYNDVGNPTTAFSPVIFFPTE